MKFYKNTDFGLTLKRIVFVLWYKRNYIIYINVKEITVSQHRDSVILSTLNQRQKLTLKQRSFLHYNEFCSYILSNGHNTSNRRRFHVEISSIRQYRQKSTSFRRPFWCNFDTRKIDVNFNVPFWCNSDGWEIDATSTSFFWCVFQSQRILVVLMSTFGKFSTS